MKVCISCDLSKSVENFYAGRNECRCCVAERSKAWKERNRDRTKAYNSQYRRDRMSVDPMFKLLAAMRTRTYIALKSKGFKKVSKISEYLGCSPSELRNYLQSKFQTGMSWDNHGEWHIDHIYPLSLAKTVKELIDLCHYTNLRPLWANDNIKKGNRVNLIE